MSDFHTCTHRDWDLKKVKEQDAGEWHLYAKCNECGRTKSALVDFPRDYANCQPVPMGEFEQAVVE